MASGLETAILYFFSLMRQMLVTRSNQLMGLRQHPTLNAVLLPAPRLIDHQTNEQPLNKIKGSNVRHSKVLALHLRIQRNKARRRKLQTTQENLLPGQHRTTQRGGPLQPLYHSSSHNTFISSNNTFISTSMPHKRNPMLYNCSNFKKLCIFSRRNHIFVIISCSSCMPLQLMPIRLIFRQLLLHNNSNKLPNSSKINFSN
mmetsp:Transcript_23892/g.31740  ORF Transcript_23892/g.31740 Transcript_23892/m.31740 type:complete len:201 (+) Transcript_23892:71-673(+)